MRVRVPDYYKNFKCIASECKDTCCAGWEVDVDEKAQEYYKTVEGDFGKRLKENTIIDEDGIRFTLTGDRRCCFLNDCNLCDLYTALGEEHLCDTCTDFPRFSEEFGELKEKGISLSCPTAASLIINHEKPLTFEEEDVDEMIAMNEIEYDLYMQLTAARALAFSIAQNRNKDILWRMMAVLLMANDIQKYIDKGHYKKIAKVIAHYSQEKWIDRQILKMGKKSMKHVNGMMNTDLILEQFLQFEVVNEEWPQLLEKAKQVNRDVANSDADYQAYFTTCSAKYEQILMYFLYRYFMKTVYNYDLIANVKLGIISILVIRSVEKAQWMYHKKELFLDEFIWLAHLYSKEIEHSDENMDAILDFCHTRICFHLEALIASLL